MFRGYQKSFPDSYSEVNIVKLTASRGKELHKDVIRPLPYFTIINTSNRQAELEYDWIRYGKLDIDGVMKSLGESGIEEMVVENVSFLMPKDWILDKKELERETPNIWDIATTFVVTFESKFIEAWMDGQLRAKVEEVMGDQIRDYRFKHSVLDLVGIADAKSWGRGVKNEFDDLETNPRRLRLALRQLDPDGDLAYLRQYRLVEGRYWRLARIASVKEW
jgi:hypothetical protein